MSASLAIGGVTAAGRAASAFGHVFTFAQLCCICLTRSELMTQVAELQAAVAAESQHRKQAEQQLAAAAQEAAEVAATKHALSEELAAEKIKVLALLVHARVVSSPWQYQRPALVIFADCRCGHLARSVMHCH